MEPEFTVGVVSQAVAWSLAAATLLYAAGTARYAYRGLQAGLEDRWSAVVATFVMFALSGMLAWFGADVFPAPFSLFVIVVFAGAIIFTLTYTLARIHDHIEAFQHQFGARLQALLEKTLPEDRLEEMRRLRAKRLEDSEARRKTPHLLMGLFLAFYLAIGFLVVRAIWETAYGGSGFGGEGIDNLYAASHADPGLYLVAGHLFGLMLLLSLLFVLAPTELLRLRFPETGYPFKAVITSNLRDKEAGLFGAHYYITAALPLAALWLARDTAHWNTGIPAILAVISVTVFADTASALIGIRFGRRKLPHNRDKSYAGTLGGGAVAFLVALPFVGVPVGFAAAGVFILMDVLGPVPFPVSDNLLNPLGLAAAFTLLQGQIDPLIPFY